MIKGKRFALVYRIAALLFSIAGVLSMLGLFRGEPRPRLLMYYTLQSNILVIVFFAALTVRTAIGLREKNHRHAGYFSRIEMVCTIDILLTLAVYWVLLAPTIFSMVEGYSLWTFGNLAVHGITPLLCLADYIMFTQPRHLKYKDVYFVLIFPFAYLAGTTVAGLLGYVYMISSADGNPMRFPYFFCDFDRLGVFALVYIVVMAVLFLLLSHGFYFIDSKIRKKV